MYNWKCQKSYKNLIKNWIIIQKHLNARGTIMTPIIIFPTTTGKTIFQMVKQNVLYKEEALEQISPIIVGVVELGNKEASFSKGNGITIKTMPHSTID